MARAVGQPPTRATSRSRFFVRTSSLMSRTSRPTPRVESGHPRPPPLSLFLPVCSRSLPRAHPTHNNNPYVPAYWPAVARRLESGLMRPFSGGTRLVLQDRCHTSATLFCGPALARTLGSCGSYRVQKRASGGIAAVARAIEHAQAGLRLEADPCSPAQSISPAPSPERTGMVPSGVPCVQAAD